MCRNFIELVLPIAQGRQYGNCVVDIGLRCISLGGLCDCLLLNPQNGLMARSCAMRDGAAGHWRAVPRTRRCS